MEASGYTTVWVALNEGCVVCGSGEVFEHEAMRYGGGGAVGEVGGAAEQSRGEGDEMEGVEHGGGAAGGGKSWLDDLRWIGVVGVDGCGVEVSGEVRAVPVT